MGVLCGRAVLLQRRPATHKVAGHERVVVLESSEPPREVFRSAALSRLVMRRTSSTSVRLCSTNCSKVRMAGLSGCRMKLFRMHEQELEDETRRHRPA